MILPHSRMGGFAIAGGAPFHIRAQDRRALLDLLTGTSPSPHDAGQRYFNRDVIEMETDELLTERARVRFRLMFEHSVWWVERLAAIEAELAQRKAIRNGR